MPSKEFRPSFGRERVTLCTRLGSLQRGITTLSIGGWGGSDRRYVWKGRGPIFAS